jgi:hypothetical protein
MRPSSFVGSIEGEGKVKAQIEYIRGMLISQDAQRIFLSIAQTVRDEARRNAPVGKHTFTRLKDRVGWKAGNLRSSIVAKGVSQTARIAQGPAAFSVVQMYRGRPVARHAHLVEFGTRERLPKQKSTMVFLDSSGSRWVRAKRTKGVAPNPFFRRAVESKGIPGLDQAASEMEKLLTK